MFKDFKTVEYIFWLPIYRHFLIPYFFNNVLLFDEVFTYVLQCIGKTPLNANQLELV